MWNTHKLIWVGRMEYYECERSIPKTKRSSAQRMSLPIMMGPLYGPFNVTMEILRDYDRRSTATFIFNRPIRRLALLLTLASCGCTSNSRQIIFLLSPCVSVWKILVHADRRIRCVQFVGDFLLQGLRNSFLCVQCKFVRLLILICFSLFVFFCRSTS